MLIEDVNCRMVNGHAGGLVKARGEANLKTQQAAEDAGVAYRERDMSLEGCSFKKDYLSSRRVVY